MSWSAASTPRTFRARARLERGSAAVEYAIVGALVAAVLVVTVAVLGGRVRGLFCTVADALDLSGVLGSCS